MTTDPTSPQSLPEVAQLAIQNRRDIAAFSEAFSGFAERLTAAHERMTQTLTDLIQDSRELRAQVAELTVAQQRTDGSIAALTDGLSELRAQVAELTVAQQRTDGSIAALTDGLSELRAQVAELTVAQQRTDGSIAALTDGLSELRAQVAELTVAQQRTDGSIAALTDGLSELRMQTLALTVAQQRTDGSIAALTDGLSELRMQTLALTEAQSQTNKMLAASDQRMDERMGQLSGRISDLTGGRYEKRAAVVFQRRARRRFGLVTASLSHTAWGDVNSILSDAANSNDISDDEFYDLNRVDMILTGQDESGDTVHVTVEMSITVESDDVLRSARRANILRKATGQIVHAAAIGEDAATNAMALAENRKVAVMIIPAPAERD